MDKLRKALKALEVDEIRKLWREAIAANDVKQMDICHRALEGSRWAIEECARVIDAARAMEDGR